MRERTALEEKLGALARIDRELDDAVTLIELGEAEDDNDTEQEGLELLRQLKGDVERRQLERAGPGLEKRVLAGR